MHIGRKKSVMERAHDYVESVADTVIPQLEAAMENARDKAGPALADARDKAAPLVSDARDRAVILTHDARDRAVQVGILDRDLANDHGRDPHGRGLDGAHGEGQQDGASGAQHVVGLDEDARARDVHGVADEAAARVLELDPLDDR